MKSEPQQDWGLSEGNYSILGPPLTDGEDALSWISSQKWSNGKVGTIGKDESIWLRIMKRLGLRES
jgi:hypothetical protein